MTLHLDPSRGRLVAMPEPREPRRPVKIVTRLSRPNIDYRCDTCGKRRKREELMAKMIQWRGMGAKGGVVRSRVVSWECKSCMKKDPDYNRTRLADAHGYADTILSRRYEDQEED